jgi:transcription termination factor NusB
MVDKAILLTAISEFKSIKIDAKIIIDQALVTAKYYGEQNSSGYINAILDKILISKNG